MIIFINIWRENGIFSNEVLYFMKNFVLRMEMTDKFQFSEKMGKCVKLEDLFKLKGNTPGPTHITKKNTAVCCATKLPLPSLPTSFKEVTSKNNITFSLTG